MDIRVIEKLFKTKDGRDISIPLGGSLGLLALGDIGLLVWRLKKNHSFGIDNSTATHEG